MCFYLVLFALFSPQLIKHTFKSIVLSLHFISLLNNNNNKKPECFTNLSSFLKAHAHTTSVFKIIEHVLQHTCYVTLLLFNSSVIVMFWVQWLQTYIAKSQHFPFDNFHIKIFELYYKQRSQTLK